jgi:hypothetical protein
MDRPTIDMIFVDKHDADNDPDTWTYYRITSVTGLGNPQNTEGSTVQICRLTWPKLEDIPPETDSPGVVTFVSAYGVTNRALEHWGIDREKSVLIGFRYR